MRKVCDAADAVSGQQVDLQFELIGRHVAQHGGEALAFDVELQMSTRHAMHAPTVMLVPASCWPDVCWASSAIWRAMMAATVQLVAAGP